MSMWYLGIIWRFIYDQGEILKSSIHVLDIVSLITWQRENLYCYSIYMFSFVFSEKQILHIPGKKIVMGMYAALYFSFGHTSKWTCARISPHTPNLTLLHSSL